VHSLNGDAQLLRREAQLVEDGQNSTLDLTPLMHWHDRTVSHRAIMGSQLDRESLVNRLRQFRFFNQLASRRRVRPLVVNVVITRGSSASQGGFPTIAGQPVTMKVASTFLARGARMAAGAGRLVAKDPIPDAVHEPVANMTIEKPIKRTTLRVESSFADAFPGEQPCLLEDIVSLLARQLEFRPEQVDDPFNRGEHLRLAHAYW
jgi:hypothetical protein